MQQYRSIHTQKNGTQSRISSNYIDILFIGKPTGRPPCLVLNWASEKQKDFTKELTRGKSLFFTCPV